MSKYVENGLYVLFKVWFLTGSKGIFVSARNLLFFFPFWVWGKVIVFCLRETELHPIFFSWTGERVNFFFSCWKERTVQVPFTQVFSFPCWARVNHVFLGLQRERITSIMSQLSREVNFVFLWLTAVLLSMYQRDTMLELFSFRQFQRGGKNLLVREHKLHCF